MKLNFLHNLALILLLGIVTTSFGQSSLSTEKLNATDYRLNYFEYEVYTLGVWEPFINVSYVYSPVSQVGHMDLDFFTVGNYLQAPWMANAEQKIWDGSSWQNQIKFFNTFDDDDDRRERLDIQEWDGDSYEPDSRAQYVYDISGNISSETYLNYVGAVYENSYLREFTYDADRLANITEKEWDDIESEWINDFLIVYTYNIDGRLEVINYSIWDGSSWEDTYREVYSYDMNGNISEILEQDYDAGWVNEDRRTYTNDENNFCIELLYEEWSDTEWVSQLKLERTEFSNGYPELMTAYSWDGVIWNPEFRINFEYEEYDNGITTVENFEALDWNVYPVPANDVLMVDFDNHDYSFVEIIDLKGRVVFRQALDGNQTTPLTIQLSELNLPSGTYL